MSLSPASLIVAESQLKLVESIISAMRAADIAVARGGAGGAPPRAFPAYDRFEPSQSRTVVQARGHFPPAPVHQPAPPMLHVTPRVSQTLAEHSLSSVCPCETYPKHIEPTFVPPWRVLPWPEQSHEVRRVKSVLAQPDMLVKGLLIDLFV